MVIGNSRRVFLTVAYIIVTFVALLCIFPFWMVVIGSFTPENEIYTRGYSLWPQSFSTAAYGLAFEDPQQILRAYCVTIGITAIGTFVALFITSMCGYVLQRPDLRSRNFLTMFVFFTVLFNGGLVPWYTGFKFHT